MQPKKLQFVDNEAVKEYECGICLGVFKDPCFACKDHVFCRTCITQWEIKAQLTRIAFTCPLCRKPAEVKQNNCIDLKKEMEALLVKCPNHEITLDKAFYLKDNMPRLKDTILKSWSNDCDESINDRQHVARSQSRSRSRSRDRNNVAEEKQSQDIRPTYNKRNLPANDVIASHLCSWIGTWSELNQHIKECAFAVIKCRHSAGAIYSHLILKKDKEKHDRTCCFYPVECRFCNKKIQRNLHTMHIELECEAYKAETEQVALQDE
eukprot:389777_1